MKVKGHFWLGKTIPIDYRKKKKKKKKSVFPSTTKKLKITLLLLCSLCKHILHMITHYINVIFYFTEKKYIFKDQSQIMSATKGGRRNCFNPLQLPCHFSTDVYNGKLLCPTQNNLFKHKSKL